MNEQQLEGFLGIKFGTSSEDVKDFMFTKPNCTIDLENSDNNQLFFEGAKFAGREPLFILFKFVDNKFHTACVLIKPKLESQTIDLYNEIKNEVNEKYYKTEEDYETYKYPYEKNDGHTETAIELGKATFSAFWKFNSSSDENYIALSITEGLHIKINYQDGSLVQIAVDREKAKNIDDY